MRDLPTFEIEEIKGIVQRAYGLQIKKIKPHRYIFKLETNLGTLFFKPFHLSEDILKLIVEVQSHLTEQGFNQFIPFIPTLQGCPYYKQGQQLFYLTRWIDCHPSNYNNPFELRQVMELFGHFHKMARNFQPINKMPQLLGRWPEIFQDRINQLTESKMIASNKNYSNIVDNFFLKKIDFYLEESHRALNLLAETDYHHLCQLARKISSFCHHDPAHHNVLITPDNRAYLIDFDYIISDLHLHDLASIIIRNGKSSNWNMRRCEYILEAYQQVKPITSQELAVIHAFITFPYDFWFIINEYYILEKNWNPDRTFQELYKKTRYEDSRQQFLNKFYNNIEKMALE